MDGPSRERLAGIIAGVIRDVCAHWGVTVEPLDVPLGAFEIVSVVGFTGDAVRGSLGLGVERTFLRHVLGSAPDALAEDWLGEAANQLLGRTKNRLVEHGVTVAVAMPMVLRGLRIELGHADAGVLTFPMQTSAGPLVVWFDVAPEASFVLRPPSADAEPCAPEGAIVLF